MLFVTLPLRSIVLRGAWIKPSDAAHTRICSVASHTYFGACKSAVHMLCELWALLPRVLGPKPKSTTGAQQDWAIRGTGSAPWIQTSGGGRCQCFGKDINSKNTKVTLKLDDLAGALWKRTVLEEEPKGPREMFRSRV